MRRLWLRVRESRFARDSTILQLGSLLMSMLSLVGVLLLSHILGARKQGEYYLGIAVFSALWFALNLGVHAVASTMVAAAHEREDESEVRDWLAFALEATLLMGTLCAVLCWFLVPSLLDWWLGEDSSHAGRVAFYTFLLALEPLIALPKLLCLVAFQGQRRMGSLTRLENSSEWLRVLLVVAGAFWSGSVLGAVVGQLIAATLSCALAWMYYRQERSYRPGLPTMGSVIRRIGRVRLAGRWGLGIRMGLVRNIDAYSVQVLPALILDRFGSTQWVAYLRIAQRIVAVLRLLVTGVGRTGLAALGQAGVAADRTRFAKVYRQTTLIGGLTVIAFAAVLVPILPWFLRTFWPQDYVQPVQTCVLILIPGAIVMGFSVVNDVFYLVSKRLNVGIAISVWNFVLQMPLLFWMASRWPELGVPIGLSVIYSSSALHIIYALYWLRRNQGGRAAPLSQPSTAPRA